MKFWGLTVSLVPMEQDLFYEQGRENDPHLIPTALEKIGAIPLAENSRPIRLGQVIRKDSNLIGFYTRMEIAHLFDEDFTRHDQVSFPPRLWAWDQTEQTLLIQVDKHIFTDAESAARAFQALLAPILAKTQLEVRIYPKVAEESFWTSANEFTAINEVTFEFVTPNMFGETKADMTEYLRSVRTATNATVVATKLINEDGKLHPKKNGFLARSLDWIKDGGGKWSIKGRLAPNSRLTTRSSGKQAKIYMLPDGSTHLNAKDYTANDLVKIIGALRDQYTYRSKD